MARQRRSENAAVVSSRSPVSGRVAQVVQLRRPETAPPALVTARVEALDVDLRTATVRLGSTQVEVTLDAAVDAVVVETARARGERVLVERDGEGWVLIGALRTSATPGIDPGDDYEIRARRIALRGAHEIVIEAGASRLALRAIGQMELLSKNITARAQGVTRFFARMIHMN
jgi:hypothetical protein